jgi:hypothetical protein
MYLKWGMVEERERGNGVQMGGGGGQFTANQGSERTDRTTTQRRDSK